MSRAWCPAPEAGSGTDAGWSDGDLDSPESKRAGYHMLCSLGYQRLPPLRRPMKKHKPSNPNLLCVSYSSLKAVNGCMRWEL